MTRCAYCRRKSVIIITKPLCKNHFTHYLERKVKKTIKKFGLINPKKKILVVNLGDASSATAIYLMKKFYPDVDVVDEKDKNKIIKNNDQIVLNHNLDDEAENIMTSIAQGNKKRLAELGPKTFNMVKPLYLCTQEEIKVYAKLKKLKFKTSKSKKSDMKKLLDNFDKRYKGVKHSIVSSYLDIMPLIKKSLLKTKA